MEIRSRSAAETGVLSYERKVVGGDFEGRFVVHASLRLLGFLCVFFGFGFIGLFLLYALGTQTSGLWDLTTVVFFSPFVAFGGSGVVYWICGSRLLKGSATAAFVALVLATLHSCLFLLIAVASAIAVFNGGYMALVSLLVSGLFMLGLGDLMRNLYRFLRVRAYSRDSA